MLYGPLQLKPFFKSIDEIADMTDEQILYLALAAKKQNEKKDNRMVFDPDTATEEEQHQQQRLLGRALGLSEEQINLQWDLRNEPNKQYVRTQLSDADKPVHFPRKRNKIVHEPKPQPKRQSHATPIN